MREDSDLVPGCAGLVGACGAVFLFAAVISSLSRSAREVADREHRAADEAAQSPQQHGNPGENSSTAEPPDVSQDSMALREMLRAGEEEYRREAVESARRMFERVSEIAPGSEEASQAERWLERVEAPRVDLENYATAEGYYYASRHAQARAYLERIVERGEDDRPVVERARELLHKIEEEGPAREEAERWLTMGKNYFFNGNRAKAREYFEKVMNLLPGSDLAAEANSWREKCR